MMMNTGVMTVCKVISDVALGDKGRLRAAALESGGASPSIAVRKLEKVSLHAQDTGLCLEPMMMMMMMMIIIMLMMLIAAPCDVMMMLVTPT